MHKLYYNGITLVLKDENDMLVNEFVDYEQADAYLQEHNIEYEIIDESGEDNL